MYSHLPKPPVFPQLDTMQSPPTVSHAEGAMDVKSDSSCLQDGFLIPKPLPPHFWTLTQPGYSDDVDPFTSAGRIAKSTLNTFLACALGARSAWTAVDEEDAFLARLTTMFRANHGSAIDVEAARLVLQSLLLYRVKYRLRYRQPPVKAEDEGEKLRNYVKWSVDRMLEHRDGLGLKRRQILRAAAVDAVDTKDTAPDTDPALGATKAVRKPEKCPKRESSPAGARLTKDPARQEVPRLRLALANLSSSHFLKESKDFPGEGKDGWNYRQQVSSSSEDEDGWKEYWAEDSDSEVEEQKQKWTAEVVRADAGSPVSRNALENWAEFRAQLETMRPSSPTVPLRKRRPIRRPLWV